MCILDSYISMHHLCIFDLHYIDFVYAFQYSYRVIRKWTKQKTECTHEIHLYQVCGWDTICSWTVSQLDCSCLGFPAVGSHSQAPWSPPPQRPVTKESKDAPHCMGKKPCPDTMFFQGQSRYVLLLALCAGLVCSSSLIIHLHDFVSYSVWSRSNGGLWAMGGGVLSHVYQTQRTPPSNRVCFDFAT